jgi:hypothetical protein
VVSAALREFNTMTTVGQSLRVVTGWYWKMPRLR